MEYERKQEHASVAWYKLADLIARGEREKALSVYRLLAHSLDDKAYALQLEGDVLSALDDPRAKEKYFQAATLYKTEKRWADAAALSEHLLALHPKDPIFLLFAVYCYAVLEVESKVRQHYTSFVENITSREITTDSFIEELTALQALAQQRPWLASVLCRPISPQ